MPKGFASAMVICGRVVSLVVEVEVGRGREEGAKKKELLRAGVRSRPAFF
jgi:hypothetical protein